jgi:hypothetical protein
MKTRIFLILILIFITQTFLYSNDSIPKEQEFLEFYLQEVILNESENFYNSIEQYRINREQFLKATNIEFFKDYKNCDECLFYGTDLDNDSRKEYIVSLTQGSGRFNEVSVYKKQSNEYVEISGNIIGGQYNSVSIVEFKAEKYLVNNHYYYGYLYYIEIFKITREKVVKLFSVKLNNPCYVEKNCSSEICKKVEELVALTTAENLYLSEQSFNTLLPSSNKVYFNIDKKIFENKNGDTFKHKAELIVTERFLSFVNKDILKVYNGKYHDRKIERIIFEEVDFNNDGFQDLFWYDVKSIDYPSDYYKNINWIIYQGSKSGKFKKMPKMQLQIKSPGVTSDFFFIKLNDLTYTLEFYGNHNISIYLIQGKAISRIGLLKIKEKRTIIKIDKEKNGT